jgi:nitrile hydratase accessory protein
MPDGRPTTLLDDAGPAAPPRRNGELVFAAPWESRLFGLTIALHERGLFVWDEFRDLLIDEIGAWERSTPSREWSYYARWQGALERLLAAKGLLGAPELDARTHAFAARPHGHDH